MIKGQKFDVEYFAARNRWFQGGWESLVDNYREYQAAVKDDPGKRLFGTKEARLAARGCSSSLETLGRCVAKSLGLPYEMWGNDEESQIYVALKGHLWHVCGSPSSPKGLEEAQYS